MSEKLIIVTGAAGVLGQAVVSHLAAAGDRVLAIDLAAAMPDRGQVGFAGGVDLAAPAALASATARLLGDTDGLDGLANIAGGFLWESAGEGDVESWDRMYRTNLRTAVACCQAALPLLRRRRGAIVNVGAQATLRAGPGMGAYAASKSGVARLTESLAEEEKARGVRVNAVLPTIIDTPANRRDMPDADPSLWVKPEALAAVVAFLLSPAAAAVTGAGIAVAGQS